MRIAALLARLLLVVGLAFAVASPSFVDRREPTFEELFERFRASDVTITYHRRAPVLPLIAEIQGRANTFVLAKHADTHLRVDGSDLSSRYSSSPFPVLYAEVFRFWWVVTPQSATYCQSHVANSASLPNCITGSPEGGEVIEQLMSRDLLLPQALHDETDNGDEIRWSRQEGRVVLGLPSSCYRATPPNEGTFTLCLTDRGELLYASVRDEYGETAIEATSVDHSVDMSLFDTKKFLNED